ncbi:uncharacterized protein IL334_006048 [Kwoniella shivajii]|uniref:Zn(2)-C6 fungal-type domain-containing protein n=1 Tax=Kwoniella shivajii TaxID=564305 RepID=A0ABZ1D6Q1_9TREE|nr:hypothetical protein IL334_006048 [Kwoniella shivajii]
MQASSSSSPSPRPAKRTRTVEGSRGKDKRERCINACNRCKAKKLKCIRSDDNNLDCGPCIKALEECTFEDTVMRPGYTKYMIALENRCAKLEKALANINPSHPEINDHYDPNNKNTTISRLDLQQSLQSEETAILPSRLSMTSLLQSSSSVRQACQRHPTDLGSVMQPSSPPQLPINPNPVAPSIMAAEDLLNTVYYHIQCRYPFLDWKQLRQWHADRDRYLHTPIDGSLGDQTIAFFLWAIYAIGAELQGAPGLDTAASYFEQAWKHLDTIVIPHDLTSIRAVLLATFYAFRATSGPSLWLLSGIAMRLCVEIGLYKKGPQNHNPLEHEWKKRVFWSAYTFDRLVSHACGRPVSLSDNLIEIEMPLDVDTSIEDPAIIISHMISPGVDKLSPRPTNMTSAIVSIKMYRIRSRIHGEMFTPTAPAPTREVTVGFLTELEEWRQAIPKLALGENIPMQAEDRFRWRYFLCVLLVLRPSILTATAADQTLYLCATAAAEACELDRTVHKGPATCHTTVSLCHTLLCGTTLLYCLHICPTVISQRVAARAIRACSGTLAVYSQLFSEARPFYEVFEHMADEILGEPTINGKDRVIRAMTALFHGNFEPLANLYDSLRSPTADTSQSRSPLSAAARQPYGPDPKYLDSLQSTGLTPFLTDTLGPEVDLSTQLTTNSGNDGINPRETLDLAWLNMDSALWEYMT